MSRRDFLSDPTLSIVMPGRLVRPDGSLIPHDFGTALSVGGSILGGMMQGDAAESAAEAQGQATGAAIGEQRRQYDTTRRDTAPWRDAGGLAINKLSDLLGLGSGYSSDPRYRSIIDRLNNDLDQQHRAQYGGMSIWDSPSADIRDQQIRRNEETARSEFESLYPDAVRPAGQESDLLRKFTLADFWDDPVTKASFDFGLQEGTKALDRMGGAKGMRNSGAQLKALTRYGTDYTGTKAGDSYNRFKSDQDSVYNKLAGVAGAGQTAVTNTAQMGQNSANTIGGLLSAQGNARGAAAIGAGNAWGGALGNAGSAVQQRSIMDQILNRNASANWGGGSWV